jgi:hypothetical protein
VGVRRVEKLVAVTGGADFSVGTKLGKVSDSSLFPLSLCVSAEDRERERGLVKDRLIHINSEIR